ncbi:hypothetical protein SK128_021008, partial [Halocaridina rubra]
MSVDKLSTSRRSKSTQRKSVPLGNAPFSESDIPGTLRLSRAPVRPTSDTELNFTHTSRPSSFCEGDTLESASLDWMDPALGSSPAISGPVEGMETHSRHQEEASMECEKKVCETAEVAAAVSPTEKALKRSTSDIGGESLMDEVMKEVEKITDIKDDVRNKRMRKDDESVIHVNDKIPLLDTSDDGERLNPHDSSCLSASDETLLMAAGVTQSTANKVVRRKATESISTTLSIASTCRAESLTSGYFSDSDVTLSERCDSAANKSTVISLSPEGTEKRKSAFIAVTPDYKDANVFSFTTVSSDSKDQSTSGATSEMEAMAPEPMPKTTEMKTLSTQKTSCSLSRKETENNSDKMMVAPQPSVTQETKVATVSKRESIYSKIMKKKDPSKEPVYAKIKPKLNIETSFQPIEPNVSKIISNSPGVVKPEPKYTTVKPRDPGAPVVPLSPTSPTSPLFPGFPVVSSGPSSPVISESAVSPFSKYGTLGSISSRNNENVAVKSKDVRSNTLPKEPIYSKVHKNTGILTKDTKEPVYSKVKPKEPIYAKPLPLTPREEALQKRESFITGNSSSNSSDYYGKVTVRATEISQTTPSRPAVITINNPGYAAPTGIEGSASLSPTSPTSPTSLVWPSSTATTITSSSSASSTAGKVNPSSQMKMIEQRPTRSALSPVESPEPRPLVASESSLVESSDTESTGRAKLSQLVEELAQELEAVSRRIGTTTAATDESKKEVLAKLLSTYDIPKNLRRVEEADENDVLEAEKSLVPTSISMDELRYVDDNEDNAETIYADIPDYSHDEFVIALDDENDPKYASLTREMRRKKSRDGDSPGRVSRRTAHVYANAINVVSALKVLINSKSTQAAAVLSKMSTLARPYTHKVQGSMSDTSWIQRVIYHKT